MCDFSTVIKLNFRILAGSWRDNVHFVNRSPSEPTSYACRCYV